MTDVATVRSDRQSLPEMPGPSSAERFEGACQEFTLEQVRLEVALRDLSFTGDPDSDDIRARIDGANQFLAERHAHLLNAARAASRPAKKSEIAKHLTVLVASTAGAKTDMAIFAEALIEDIGSLSPAIGAVEAACRKLRRTMTFVPAIAECMRAVQASAASLATVTARLEEFPEFVAGIPAVLAEVRADRRRRAEQHQRETAAAMERREARKAEIRRRFDEGKNISMCERNLVEEILAERQAGTAASSEVPRP